MLISASPSESKLIGRDLAAVVNYATNRRAWGMRSGALCRIGVIGTGTSAESV
jgi:hypothetical protein